jgi:hypothetical protein
MFGIGDVNLFYKKAMRVNDLNKIVYRNAYVYTHLSEKNQASKN